MCTEVSCTCQEGEEVCYEFRPMGCADYTGVYLCGFCKALIIFPCWEGKMNNKTKMTCEKKGQGAPKCHGVGQNAIHNSKEQWLV